ncbi:broad-complex core protein isoform X2 [Arctopsyche grandis]|uniref:broad-complex core protein isoform X2 n=1 Tax=Arctopsyche grandis TaxID=121162 RepID=UPI00406D8179
MRERSWSGSTNGTEDETFATMVDTHQHFCLRWNNYQSSITSAFENLRDDEDFVDVTLACDGKSLKAHRVVLSACSPYFRELLKSTPCKHPVIVLQDVAFTDLHALVEFIYHGEVNVHQRSLSSFLKTAEVLRVSGLTQHEDGQGLAHMQSMARAAAAGAAAAATPPPGGPLAPAYCDKLEEALLSHPHSALTTVHQQLRRNHHPRRVSRSSDNSPDAAKRPRHDNNNTDLVSQMPQLTPADFSTKHHLNSRLNHHHEPAGNNNGNGVSNSSGSPSPRLIDDVKHEPIDLLCGAAADLDRNDESPPPQHHRQHLGPSSRGSSAEADERTPPPLPPPPPPFLSPSDAKLFTPGGSFNFSMASLADHSPLAGLGSPTLTPDGLAGTSQGGGLRMPPPTSGGINEPQECPYCRRTFSCYYSLKRHFQDKHEQSDTLYVCEFCHRRYRTKNSLTTHKSLQHRGSSGMLKRLLKTSALQSALTPSPHHLFDLAAAGDPAAQPPPGIQ